MKTAFSVWAQRIAPVFDTASRVTIIEGRGEGQAGDAARVIPGESAWPRIAWLAGQGVDTLVCGAVSRPVREMLAAVGIRVVPFVAGELRAVVRAWQAGELRGDAFAMPGCCGRNRRRRGGAGCCAARQTL